MDACFKMLTRLPGVMKLGFRQVKTITSAIKITKMKYSLMSAPIFFFSFMLSPSFIP